MGAKHRYLIGLGSNRRHPRYGRPRDVVEAAVIALVEHGVHIERVSPIVLTAPIGPSLRRYANAAAVIGTDRGPHKLLRLLKKLEREFGRRQGGQRWTSRVLDLDIVLWNGGPYAAPDLIIPHPLFRERGFVLEPAVAVAPDWRDPLSGLTVRQLRARLTAPRPLSR